MTAEETVTYVLGIILKLVSHKSKEFTQSVIKGLHKELDEIIKFDDDE